MKILKANEGNLIKENKIAVVDFFATWCGPCKQMKPFYEKAEAELNKMGAEVFEADVDVCEELANANGIQYVPTVIVYEDGKELNRFSGAKDDEEIIDFVKKAIAK